MLAQILIHKIVHNFSLCKKRGFSTRFLLIFNSRKDFLPLPVKRNQNGFFCKRIRFWHFSEILYLVVRIAKERESRRPPQQPHLQHRYLCRRS